jgi:signal transduction histidine kinase
MTDSQHNGAMLALLTRIIRAGACLAIGILTFGSTPAGGVELVLEIAAYAISVAAISYWLINDRRGSTDRNPALAWALGIMAVAAGVMSTAPNATAFIGFPLIASLAMGADTAELSGWIGTASAIVAVEAGGLIWHPTTGSTIGYPLILILGFISGRNRRAYLLKAEQSAAMVAQLELLRAEQRQVAILDERTRIAREIHDVLAHSLGALGIHIQVVRAVLTEHRDVEQALGLLEQAQRMATDGLVDSRRAIEALRGGSTNLDEQIAALAETHRGRHQTSIDLSIEGTPMTLTPEATVALVRTAQEALVNTAKHAPHQPVEISLRYTGDEVRLTITNQLVTSNPAVDGGAGGRTGVGLVPFSSVDGGYGLTGMRERLLLINGSLTTGSDDRCWTVAALVPQ